MRSFPSHLNSKEDYYFIKDAVNEEGTKMFTEDQWKPAWENLLEERFVWIDTKELADKSEGTEDDTHRVVEISSMDPDNPIKYSQQELIEDPSSDFAKYRFTEEEVLSALKESK